MKFLKQIPEDGYKQLVGSGMKEMFKKGFNDLRSGQELYSS